MSDILQELTPYLIGILGVLLTFLGRKLNIFLNERIDKGQWNLIKDIVQGAVMFVEQISKQDVGLYGEKKFNLAKQRALEVLNDKGLFVSEKELDMLIEAFVLELQNKGEDK